MCALCNIFDEFFTDTEYIELSGEALSKSQVTVEGLSTPTPPAQIVLGQKGVIHVGFYN